MTVIMAEETLEVDREVGNIEIETDTETMIHTDRIIDEVEIDGQVVVQDGNESQRRENCMIEIGLIVKMIGTVWIGMKFYERICEMQFYFVVDPRMETIA